MANEENIGEEVVPEGGDPAGTGTLEGVNLVAKLKGKKVSEKQEGDDILKFWGAMTVEQEADDFHGNRPLYQQMARTLELFLGIQDTYDFGPAKGRPRPSMPVVNKTVTRIYNRMAAVITKIEPVVVPTGPEDEERAGRVALHMAWEKSAKHPEWKATMSASLLLMINVGTMIRRVAYDPVKKKKDISWLGPTDCIVAASEKDMSPYMEKVGRVTCRLRKRRQEIEELGTVGPKGEPAFFAGIDDLFKEDATDDARPSPIREDDETNDPIRRVRQEFERLQPQGRTNQEMDPDTGNSLYMILERHSWERLPKGVAPDGDDTRLRRVVIWVEQSTKKVLRAVIKEAEDPIDRLRFKNEADAEVIRMQNLANEMQQAQDDVQQVLIQNEAEAAQGLPLTPVPPLPPTPEPNLPAPIRMTPVYDLIIYRFMESPIGFYGLGAGVFGTQLNLLANEVLGDWVVHTKLHSISGTGGYLAEEFKDGAKKGPLKIEYGRWVQTNVPAADLDNAMQNFKVDAPGSSLKELYEVFDDEAEVQMNAHEALSGVAGPSHESATAASLRQQRVGENLNMAMENVFPSLAAEYRVYARINATYMDNMEYFSVVEFDPEQPEKPKPVRKTVGRRDYEIDFDIQFNSDVRLAFDEGLGDRAMQAWQIIKESPYADENTKLAAEKKALKSLGQDEMVNRYPAFIPPPPPPEPQSQTAELAGFLEERDSPVLPDDAHDEHLFALDKFEQDGMVKQLTETGKQMFERHRQAHRAAAFTAGTQLEEENDAAEQDTAIGAARASIGSVGGGT